MLNFKRRILTVSAFAALVTGGILIESNPGQAFNDNNGAQDEMQMIRTGLEVAASLGIELNIA